MKADTKPRTAVAVIAVEAPQRRQQLLVQSGKLFARKGYRATSMRDIAAATGMKAGSLYYHFASKEALFIAVHASGMEAISSAVRRATTGIADPWTRFEAATIAHAEALLGRSDLIAVLNPDFAEGRGRVRKKLLAMRDEYEEMFDTMVRDLNLPEQIDRKIFRKLYLGALNSTPPWFRPNGALSATEIGRQLIFMLQATARKPIL
jgi:AcrR family transcriptional regulator